jgi:sorting nexin-8
MFPSGDASFVEERRKGLKRWLEIICRHPVLCNSDILRFFLTFQGQELQTAMKDQFRRTPDEFMTSPVGLEAKVCPHDFAPFPQTLDYGSEKEMISSEFWGRTWCQWFDFGFLPPFFRDL